MQIGHGPGASNSNCFEDETRTYKKTGPHYDYPRAISVREGNLLGGEKNLP